MYPSHFKLLLCYLQPWAYVVSSIVLPPWPIESHISTRTQEQAELSETPILKSRATDSPSTIQREKVPGGQAIRPGPPADGNSYDYSYGDDRQYDSDAYYSGTGYDMYHDWDEHTGTSSGETPEPSYWLNPLSSKPFVPDNTPIIWHLVVKELVPHPKPELEEDIREYTGSTADESAQYLKNKCAVEENGETTSDYGMYASLDARDVIMQLPPKAPLDFVDTMAFDTWKVAISGQSSGTRGARVLISDLESLTILNIATHPAALDINPIVDGYIYTLLKRQSRLHRFEMITVKAMDKRLPHIWKTLQDSELFRIVRSLWKLSRDQESYQRGSITDVVFYPAVAFDEEFGWGVENYSIFIKFKPTNSAFDDRDRVRIVISGSG
ncbi:hypothetical protein ABW19_dt0204919 [Dactylella cylindrospora]|nr:hypothetical protein ABW19_dt0204919 [Dactylella cylindrospora]